MSLSLIEISICREEERKGQPSLRKVPHSNLHLSSSDLPLCSQQRRQERVTGQLSVPPCTECWPLLGEQWWGNKILSAFLQIYIHTQHTASRNGLVPLNQLYIYKCVVLYLDSLQIFSFTISHYIGNAVEVNETFKDLFYILKLKAHKNKVFHQKGRDLPIMLATTSIALSRNCDCNVHFLGCLCVCMRKPACPGADFVTPCWKIFQSRQIAR